MNRHLYRVIFNAARGLLMAVQETASGLCKGSRSSRATRGFELGGQRAFVMLPMRGIAFAALCVFGMQPVFVRAQVVAAPNATAATKPAVGVTANGVPLVQITTPNAAGVSNNTYSQFNVGTQGLILNNSPSTVLTKQGGYVAGNPYLSTGSARVILNQVVGGNPSQLLGYTEVAGQQAEVIIANPSGLYCNGCGFINTTRSVLTTGTPVFGGTGSLDAFHVTNGQIQIGAAGLNASNVDQVDLIARSVQVNGKIWAGRQLDVITGANDVDHAGLGAHTLTPDANTPAFAIDVAQLGGMYAGKIQLVGTESGVGVNSAGTIQAQAGDVQLSSAGKVTLAGNTSASGNVQIQAAGDVLNSGDTYAAQGATVNAQGQVFNSGTLASMGGTAVSAASIVSTGALGGGVDSTGTLSGSGNLSLSASGTISITGQNLAGGNLAMSGSSLNLAGAQTLANGSATLTATGAGGDAGNVTLTHSTSNVGGSLGISAAGALTNDQAQTSAGQLTVTAASVSNRSGQLVQTGTGKAAIAATGDLDNTQGTIQAGGAVSLTAANVTNTAGRIVSLNGDGLTIDAGGQITNAAGTTAQGAAGGVIGGNGNVTVRGSALANSGTVTAGETLQTTLSGLLDNSNGTMSGAAVTANAGSLKNVQGTISGSTVALTVPKLDNSGGQITTNQLSISSANLTNEHGTLTQLGTGPMLMTVSNAIDNSNGGVIQTNSQDLTLTPASLNNNGGTITHAGSGTLTIDAANGTGTLTNVGGAVASNGQISVAAGTVENNGGSIASGNALNVMASGNVDNTQGTIQAGGAASLTAANVTNAAGRIVSLNSDGLTIDARGSVSNTAGMTAQGATGGVIGGNGNVTLQAGTLTNSATVTAGQALSATVNGALDNSNGAMSGAAVTANAGSLKNVQGTISGSTVALTIPQLDNSGGQITTNQLSINSTNLTNEHGTLTQLGTGVMSMAVSGAIDNSNGGVIQTNSQGLTLAPASLNNNGGTITHAGSGTLTIDAASGTGSFTNVGGTVASNGGVNIAAGGVQDNGGSITSAMALNITTSGNVDNTQGTIQAGGVASLTAANVTNAAGRIVSLNSDGLTIDASGTVSNTTGMTAQGATGGVIGGNGNVTLQAGTLTNSATVTAGQALSATVNGALDNSNGAMSGAAVTANAGSLKNVQGTISGSTVALTIPQLDNSGGQITTNQLSINSANLTNEHGTLTQLGTGVMSMAVSGAIDNSNGGVIQTNSQDLTLTPASLNNNGGTITHAGTGTLTIDAANGTGTLTNVGGTVASNGQISVAAGTVENNGGSIASGNALNVTASGNVDNTQGTIQAGGAASLTAANVTNAAGRIVSLNSDGLTIDASGTVSNTTGMTAQGATGGVIGGKGNVTLQAGTLTNSATVTAGQALSATVNGALDNSNGAMSGAAVTANAGSLKNVQGTISGSTVALTIPQLDNSGGQITTNQLSISSTNLTNEHGTLTQLGTGVMSMAVSGVIDNSNGGVIQTNSQDLTLTPASLNNNGGTITHAGSGTLTINAANGTGALTNVSGTIVSGGQANVTAGSLDNTSGTVASHGAMTANIAGALNNTGGLLHSDTDLAATSGAALTNAGGRINVGTSAGASVPSTLSVGAASIDNTNGSILNVGSGATTITGTNEIVNGNAGGASGMGSIGGNGSVTLNSTTLYNTQGGQLSGADLQINTGTLNNSGGVIGNVANSSGDIGIWASGVVYNGSGKISAARNLSLAANTLSGGGNYNAANNVTLNLQGSFTNTSAYQFNAGSNLTFNLPGTFYNADSLVAFNNLTINANSIGNAGLIEAGGWLTTNSATLTNTGSLIGSSVSLNASQGIWNLGPSALIGATDSAGLLELMAPDIENRDDSTASDTPAQTMIYGLGRVAIAGGKDASGNYTQANLITNQSALIESGGDMLLDAGVVTNTRRVLTTSGATTQVDPSVLSQLGISMSGTTGQVNTPDPNSIGGVYIDPPHGGSMNSDYMYTTYTGSAAESVITAISPKSQVVSAGNMWLNNVGTFQNYWSQVAAAGNVALPAVVDNNSWRNEAAPQVTVTYSGLYHYRTYKHDWWTMSFCQSGCNAPADIRNYALPGYDSIWSSNGTISGAGVTIINTGGNAGVTPLGLAPGQSLSGTIANAANGTVANDSRAFSTGPRVQEVVRGTPENMLRIASTSNAVSSVSGAASGGGVGPANIGNSTSPVSGSVGAPDPVLGKATALPVLTNLTVPQGGLFKRDTAPNPPYLVETNPAFTNLHQWLSSDYYFQQMGMNPDVIHMRLGDGFYEQHLVQSQIMSLTGRAVLTNYADTQSEFQSLMTSGAALAKSLNLAPGMGLSAQQVAMLTSNVVIMQTEIVEGKSVLVPVVYLAQASQENMGNGPVIEASNIDIENAQRITNSGTIRATHDLTLTAQSIDSSFGTLQSGDQMTLVTKGDLNLTSGTVKAGSLALQAGGNLTLDTAVNTLDQVGNTGATRVTKTLGPVASISVDKDALISVGGNFDQKAASLSVGGDLTAQVLGNWTLDSAQTGEHKVVQRFNGESNTNFLQGTGSNVTVSGASKIGVGGDLTATGATIKLDGGGMIAAAGNVSLLASTTTSTLHSNASGGSGHGNFSDDIRTSDDAVHGTTIESGGDLTVMAGKNMTITGSTIDLKQGNAVLGAVGDVNIGAATETHSSDNFNSGSHSGFASKTSKVDHVVQATQTADGSTISADSVSIASGKNLTIEGSSVVAMNNVALQAKGNVDITAAHDTYQDSELHDVKHSGFTGTGGIGIGYGSSEQKDQYDANSVTQSQSRSTVGSVAGNVSIVAGSDVHIGGSDVIAGKAAKDTTSATGNIAIQGQNIAIDPGLDNEHSHDQQDAHSSGVSMSLTGTPLDTVRNLRQASRSGNGFERVEGVSNELAASGADLPSVSLSFNHSSSSSTTDITSVTNAGSTIRGGGNVSLTASGGGKLDAQGNPIDGDLTMTGSTVTAGGIAKLSANRNVVLQASTDQLQQSLQSSNSSTSISLATPTPGDGSRWVSGGPNSGGVSSSPYNASRANSNGNSATVQQTASAVTGNSVVVTSKTGDIDVIGSGISGVQGVDMVAAQGAINVLAGTDTSRSHQESSSQQIGDLGSNGTGTGFTVGVSKTHMVQDQAAQTQSTIRGQVMSANGNVTLDAKKDVTVQGSDLSAGNDLTLMGQNVKLDAGTDAMQNSMSQSASHFGVSLTVGGALGNAVATINQSMAAAKHTDNKRLAKLDEAQAALSAYGAYQALGSNTQAQLVKFTVSVGGGTSHSQSESNSVTNDGSTLKAGDNVTIVATGSGAKDANGTATDGDITAHGTQISGQNVELNAARDINLESAQDTNHQASSNSSSGGSIGVAFNFGGQQNGFSIELAANAAKGHMNGDGTTNRDTQVTAGQTLSMTSGRDTNLRGARVSGDTVDANVGRDLNIASPQDTNTYESEQTSGGVQLSICVPPFCYGASGSGSFNQQTIKDNYKSVGQQSGIYAGTGGFDINVGNHTQLDGGVIASKAAADKNTLSTQTLGFTNLENESKYSGTSIGFSASGAMKGGGSGAASGVAQSPSSRPGPTNSAGMGPSGFGVAGTSNDQSGTTYAAVSPGTITVRGDAGTGHDSTAGLSRDTAHANDGALSNTFDAQKIGDDLAIQAQTVQVGMQVAGDVGSYLKSRAHDKYEQAKDELKNATDPDAKAQAQADLDSAALQEKLWSDDGAARIGLHAVVAGAGAAMGGGNVLGALGGTIAGDLASAQVNSALGDTLGGKILSNIVSGAAGAVAGAALGGASGAMSGANGALGADLYNRQLHPDERQWAKDHAKDFAKFYEDKTGQSITVDQAEKMLLANEYIRVDAAAASGGLGYDNTAAQYLTNNAGGLFTKDQYYNNPFMFGNKDGAPTPEQLALPGGTAHPVAGVVVAGAVTGGLALGPDAVAGVAAAVKACAANPVLCANQAAITAGDVAAGSAMPAGTGASVAGAAGAAGAAAATADGRASTSTLAALTEARAAAPTASGYVNATKVCESGCILAASTPDQQALVSTILRDGDQSGQLTEKLINSIGSSEGYTILSGGKYGGNNGFDHVFVDSSGNVTLLIDSKQINNGAFTLSPNAAGGNMQLSNGWVDTVLSKLDPTSSAYRAVFNARNDGTLTTAVAGVDKGTGHVVAIPVKVQGH